MIVSFLLVGFSYMLFQFVMQFLHKNVEAREHRERAEHVAALICADIERSQRACATDSMLVLIRATGERISYGRTKGKIVRNGVVITPPDSTTWTVRWHQSRDSGGVGMRPVTFSIFDTWRHGADSVLASSMIPWSSQGAMASGAEDLTK